MTPHSMNLTHPTALPRWRARRAAVTHGICLFTLLLVATGRVVGQEKIYEQEPSDWIRLNEANGGEVLKTLPLDLPGRQVPDPLPTNGSIRVRLTKNPDEQLEVAWRGIASIELFEDRILEAGRELTRGSKFDEAFEHFSFLQTQYPQTRGLDAALNELLYAEASALFRTRDFERALLLLDEIYRRTPDRPGLSAALARVLDTLFTARIDGEDYVDARRIYGVAKRKYEPSVPELIAGWQRRLEQIASGTLADSRQKLSEGELREAFLLSRKTLDVWPDLPGAAQQLMETAKRYPLINVGVLQAYGEPNRSATYGWAARRAERLLTRKLFEAVDVGPDGMDYRTPVGQSTVADDARSMTLVIAGGADHTLTAYSGLDAAHQLVEFASDDSTPFDPTWSQLLKQVTVSDVMQVDVTLQRPHLRVESLLQLPLDGSGGHRYGETWQPYEVAESSGSIRRFVVNPDYRLVQASQPREIVEHYFEHPQAAVQALRRGNVDVLDRVFPADVAALSRDAALVVRRYRLPSLHVLTPNYDRPYPANRVFRRAMAYGINRQRILARELLGGQSLPGCVVTSGPFSPGIERDDPMAYANDPRIEPRPYDPRHARTLMQLAQVELDAAAVKKGEDNPTLTQLVIAHPPCEIAALACRFIADDLQVLGIVATLRPLEPGQIVPDDNEWDFVYLDYISSEPLVDAKRLLAPDGLVRSPSPHLNLALRMLDHVDSWNAAGDRLRAIHQISYDDTSIIPLWQLSDYFAYRPVVAGMRDAPLSFYQQVEEWSVDVAGGAR